MPGQNLTREEAATRADLLAVSSYDVTLDLAGGPTTFATRSTVRFAATEGADTFIDFVGESVESVVLNGTPIDPATHWADSRIALTGLAADNELTIEATGQYTNTGEGMHRFVDPVDGEVYLYSQFEVPDSRRVFPVFEQPDLKATFAFTVTTPAGWTVRSVSPTPEPVAAGERDGRPVVTWTFAPTPRLSSYVTAVVSGPYVGVTDVAQSRKGPVQLGLWARRSLMEYLDADNLFDVTKKGFEFFEREFDSDYPFAKYDQVFAPEYNAGAMENAGCVTISELYIFRGKVNDPLVERRALTVLHELAHMWFGDLVTMHWWDDLWLNESFAEWASTLAQAEATHWTGAWTTFQSHEKTWAYQQDQLPSTHPVYADIRDLDDVLVNFDGITYAKGGSILKQLVSYVGREPTLKALQAYFRQHAWGNARFADLLAELERASGRDLGRWSELWLKTAGVNTLRVEVETDDAGVITAAAVVQTATAEYPTLRPHRIAIGRYDLVDGALVRVGRHELDVDGSPHRGARAGGPPAAGPAVAQRRRPQLRQAALRRPFLRNDSRAYRRLRREPAALARHRGPVGDGARGRGPRHGVRRPPTGDRARGAAPGRPADDHPDHQADPVAAADVGVALLRTGAPGGHRAQGRRRVARRGGERARRQ